MSKPVIVYLGNRLSNHGVNPTSVETLGERLSNNFIVIRSSSKINKLSRLIDMWRTLIKWKKADFALIDTYSTSAFTFAWTSAFLSKKLGLKYIPILHGGGLPERAIRSPRKLKNYLNNAYKVVCPSPYLKKELVKLIGIEYTVIPNAIDLEDYPFISRVGLNKSGPRILWVRAFDKIYNPSLAVNIVKKLVNKGYQEATLYMVGPDKDGSLVDTLYLTKELHLEDNIKFMGFLSKTEWIELSKSCDIFINTTNVDNTPVSVIESLALGLPVISTNVGGIPYMLNSGENAILVEPNNPEAFTIAIEDLYNNSLYRKLSQNGRATAEGYSWDQIEPQWSMVLK